MPKAQPTMTVLPHATKPYLVSVGVPLRNGFSDDIKKMPGAWFDGVRRRWDYPVECIDELPKLAEKWGFTFKDMRGQGATWTSKPQLQTIPKAGRPFQISALANIYAEGAWMVNFETGLGKTWTAIEALKLKLGATNPATFNALIVCPANVCINWTDELDKWWPYKAGRPTVEIIEDGDEAEHCQWSGIVICSYNLALKLSRPQNLHVIIFDESHYLKNDRSRRSEELVEFAHAYSDALKLMLTATPICDQPADLWHQLEVLWPGRFGSFYQFKEAYCDWKSSEFAVSGKTFFGVNQARAAELAERLKHCSTRMTKKEAAQWLPKCLVSTIRVKNEHKIDVQDLLKRMARGEETPDLDALCRDAGGYKFEPTIEQVKQDLENGEQKIVVLTYFKESARMLAETLAKETGEHVVHADGDLPPKKRDKVLRDASQAKRCILVCSMSSIAEGIDYLTPFKAVIFAELYWQPKLLIQVMGRFWRMSSTEPVAIRIILLEGSTDDVIASRVGGKLQNMGMVIEHGEGELKLQDAFKEEEMSEEQFLDELRACAAVRADD